jgi:hypothetical protein
MNPAFEEALQTRLLWMQVRSYGLLGFHHMAEAAAHEAYWRVERLAVNQARCDLPYAHPYGPKCPPLLHDVPRLAALYEHAYRDEASEVEEERKVAAQRLRQQEKTLHALACIGRNEWDALDLPTPEHLSAELYAGEGVRVDGHFLHYDSDDGVVWMDNPYGVEGCLGEEPTVALCRRFLTRIAKGGMYGPEP